LASFIFVGVVQTMGGWTHDTSWHCAVWESRHRDYQRSRAPRKDVLPLLGRGCPEPHRRGPNGVWRISDAKEANGSHRDRLHLGSRGTAVSA
jgi:hypothetical protein